MLVTESDRARAIRSRMLDIVIDVVAEKAGGHTKYINQRDQDNLPAAYMEDSYRRQFTDALRDYLAMGNHKYAVYTDKIYQSVFLENAVEYKKVLNLENKDKTRDTMYVAVVVNTYVVIIRIRGAKADFVTAFVATRSSIRKIRTNPLWQAP
jgi:hypothetical protein